MKRAFKISSLFIGTVIGAGLASGREVALYFGNLSPLVAATAGLFLGGFAASFLVAGKFGLIWKSKFYTAMVLFGSVITIAAMLAASEDILYEMTSLRFLGLLSGILGMVIVVLGIEKVKFLNTIAVPLIIAFIIILFVKNGNFAVLGGGSVFRPIAYGALNIFLASEMMVKEGEKLSGKEIAIASVLTGVFLAVMLFAIQCTIYNNQSSMPMLNVAYKLGLTIISQLLVFLAVFTTLVSAQNLMLDLTCEAIAKNKFLSSPKIAPALSGKLVPSMLVLAICYPLTLLGFDNIVDWFYPLISVFGIISTSAVLIIALKKRNKNYRHKQNKKESLRSLSVK